jgi:spermidine synthase
MDASPLPAGRRGRWLLGAVILFLGGSGLVYEYCLSTLATHLLGNSVEQFSLIIALMLFAMGIAGLAQRRVEGTVRLAAAFVAVEILLGLIGGASALLLYLAYGWMDHFRVVLYGLALIIGFGIGLEIPLLMRINEAHRPDLKDNVGEVFSLDYVGALAGALVWAFFLLPRLSLDRISLVLGLASLGVAAVTLAAFWRGLGRTRAPLVALLVAAAVALGALYAGGPRLIEITRQRLFADPVRYTAETPYQRIVVTGRGARLSLYLNGRLQLDSEDEHIYHELLVHPAMMALGRSPRTVLVLGGGDGLAVREALRWPSVEQVTLVDLDPEVTRLPREWPPMVALSEGALLDARVDVRPASGVSPGPLRTVHKAAEAPRDAIAGDREAAGRVHLLHLDADAFIRDIEGQWDVIVADFPDPSTPDLAKLYSLELYQRLHARMAPGGVFVTQAGSPYNTRRAFWSIHDTLRAAGFEVTPLHAHVPTFGEWGWLLAAARAPDPRGQPPVPVRYLTSDALAAARLFPPTLLRPESEAPGALLSTRLDPRIMHLYNAGEPLEGDAWFGGTAER